MIIPAPINQKFHYIRPYMEALGSLVKDRIT
jgi:hypothetical protein